MNELTITLLTIAEILAGATLLFALSAYEFALHVAHRWKTDEPQDSDPEDSPMFALYHKLVQNADFYRKRLLAVSILQTLAAMGLFLVLFQALNRSGAIAVLALGGLITAALFDFAAYFAARNRIEKYYPRLSLFFTPFCVAARPLVFWLEKAAFEKSNEAVDPGKFDLEPFRISTLLQRARRKPTLSETVFENVLEFKNVRIKDVMAPRTDIFALPETSTLTEVLAAFKESEFSRIIIYGKDLDDVKGFVHTLGLFGRPKSLHEMLQPVLIMPENGTAEKVLEAFNRERKSVAIVVDEFGGTAGLVTVEDVIEAVLGEVEDEHDAEDEQIEQKISDTEYLFSARLEIEYLNGKYGLNLPEGDYATLAGLILHEFARIPKNHEHLRVGACMFTVTQARFNKIETVNVKILPED